MADSVDPDQTAPLAVGSGSTLFTQTYLPENLGTLRNVASWKKKLKKNPTQANGLFPPARIENSNPVVDIVSVPMQCDKVINVIKW